MYSAESIFIGSLLLYVTTVNGHRPIDHNFINTFDASDTNQVNYRLPNNTIPVQYTISLETSIHENNFKFSGEVSITLRALESTKNITIHNRQLNIKSANLKKIGSGTSWKPTYTTDKTTEFLVFTVPDELEKDQLYTLDISYEGDLRTDMAGFYRSSYVNSKNETRFAHKLQFIKNTEIR